MCDRISARHSYSPDLNCFLHASGHVLICRLLTIGEVPFSPSPGFAGALMVPVKGLLQQSEEINGLHYCKVNVIVKST